MKIDKYTVRMPDTLADALRQVSFLTGVSMNKIFYFGLRGTLRSWFKRQAGAPTAASFPDWKNKTQKLLDEVFAEAEGWYSSLGGGK